MSEHWEEQSVEHLRLVNAGLRVELSALAFWLRLKAGFRPDQPRVPKGEPDGGQWSDEGGSSSPTLVSGRRRGAGQVRIGTRWLDATPAQHTRLSISQSQMRAALAQVRKVDPKWRPTPQTYETVEGLIKANEATALEAQFRVFELSRTRFGPGPFAKEWITAPSSSRRLTKSEQAEINRIGKTFGCHRCGTTKSGYRSGNFVGDHQKPWSVDTPTRMYPHFAGCSASQGGLLSRYREREER